MGRRRMYGRRSHLPLGLVPLGLGPLGPPAPTAPRPMIWLLDHRWTTETVAGSPRRWATLVGPPRARLVIELRAMISILDHRWTTETVAGSPRRWATLVGPLPSR